MFRSRTERATRAAAVILAGGTLLTACSDLYYDRRDTIALGGGDAIAANAIAQTVDPWPAHSGNTNIAANGQRMQSAVERYRTDKVTPPAEPTTLDIMNQQQAGQAAAAGASTPASGATPSVASASGQ